MQTLFDEVRDNCSPTIWSRGVELTRAGAVLVEQREAEEIQLKVATQQSMTFATVTLWPADDDWSCDCSSREPACAHVAAAVITLRRSQHEGTALPSSKATLGKKPSTNSSQTSARVTSACTPLPINFEPAPGKLTVA